MSPSTGWPGGRAQFVGQNQSGKSTLMALTTLILLAGDLDRQLVDTFGQQHKAFRYYVEPTDDPQDRRDTAASTSRGWAWVEYGRLTGGQPRYFTTLLYAQAKRGANDFVRTWAVCTGDTRVRAGLDLHQGASVRPPSEFDQVPGFRIARNGAEYKSWVARDLFGFADQARLDAVVRMLKVLRTPHLGQRLDPDFFTAQMREALPAIAQSEIDELAEGWDQLDALAADRDHAEAARDAVPPTCAGPGTPGRTRLCAGMPTSSPEPSPASTMSLVLSAPQKRSLVRRGRTPKISRRLEAARSEQERVEQNYEDLLTSPAYQNAYDATAQVERLKETARRSRISAGYADQDAEDARVALTRRARELATAERALAEMAVDMSDAISGAEAAAQAAGLPPGSRAWATDGDFGRLNAAVGERRECLATVRKLLSAADLARQQENSAASRAEETVAETARRADIVARAGDALDEAMQLLSDDLERWAAAVGEAAPPAALRSGWITSVIQQTTQPRPHEVLGKLLRERWLAPTVTPLRERAAVADQEARRLADAAAERDEEAARELAAPEPEPRAPVRWTRRDRPPAGPGGAPLWRLLDPRDGLPGDVLDRVEAALDAAGLLDAWVSPDAMWVADRDGHDIVLTAAPGQAGLPRPTDPATRWPQFYGLLLTLVGSPPG